MRRRWILITLVVGLLAVGVVATGAAFVHRSGSAEENSSSGEFAARVAEILGLEEQQVQDAFDQAREEMLDERIQSKLDSLVESGDLTQEQADEYKEWFDSRPEGLSPRGFHSFGHKRGHHFYKWRSYGSDDDTSEEEANDTSS